MQVIYKGSQAAVSFEVAGKDIKLAANEKVTITAEQAKSLQARNYIKALVEKGQIEFIEPKPTKTITKTETKTTK